MAIINIKVQATLQWFGKRAERTGRLIAVCDPLGIAVEADTEEELQSLMAETTHMLFVDLIEDDEFDQFLRERGWTANGRTQAPQEEVDIRVPMELVMAAAANGPQQRSR
jgi:hypothetical protein